MDMKIVEQCPHCDPTGGKRLRFPAAEQSNCGPLTRCLHCGTIYAPSVMQVVCLAAVVWLVDLLNLIFDIDSFFCYLLGMGLLAVGKRMPNHLRWRALPREIPMERQNWWLRDQLVFVTVALVLPLLTFAVTALLK